MDFKSFLARNGLSSGLIGAILCFFPSLSQASIGFSVHSGWTVTSVSELPGVKVASPLLGAELTFGVQDFLQFGPFIDRNTLYFNSGQTGYTNFYGVVVRVEVANVSGVMFDFRLGSAKTSIGSEVSNQKFSFGAGMGYRISGSGRGSMAVKPRLGFRSTPYEQGGNNFDHFMLEFDLLLSFLF